MEMYSVVTQNSVYNVINHAYSPGVSVSSWTEGGKLYENRVLFTSARVILFQNVLVLFCEGNEDPDWIRSSAIQSIVRITDNLRGDTNYVPIPSSDWAKINLVGKVRRDLATV